MDNESIIVVLQLSTKKSTITICQRNLKITNHLSLSATKISIAMKKIFALLYIVSLGACNANPSPAEVEQKLKTAMNDYLYKSVNYDSSKVKYRVQNVVYFNDKDYYDCEFKVFMSVAGGKDSMGSMNARISKDFKTVLRNY